MHFFDYIVISSILAVVALILFIVVIVFYFKKKNKILLIFAFLFLLFSYQIIPNYIFISGVQQANQDKMKTAIKLALFPYQKGVFAMSLALMQENLGQATKKDILESYDIAYKYLIKNKSMNDDLHLGINYYLDDRQFEKALKIAEEQDNEAYRYLLKYNCYGYMGEYQKALDMLMLLESKNKSKKIDYRNRAIVYKNLGEYQLAEENYQKALENEKSEKMKLKIQQDYQNSETYFKNMVEQFVVKK